jgi:hypothetical protein
MLSERERQILEARRSEVPLSQLAREQGVSRQRIAKIEKRAIAKLARPTPEQIYEGLSHVEQWVILDAASILDRKQRGALSWDHWMRIGEALLILRNAVMQITGKPKSRLFTACLREFGLDLDPAVIARLSVIMETRAAIEAWRSSLQPAERAGLNHPQVVLESWQASRTEPEEPPQ